MKDLGDEQGSYKETNKEAISQIKKSNLTM